MTTNSSPPTATSPSSRPPRSSWLPRGPWRFTIREIMLLTAAIAGFLAWANLAWQRSRPYQRTPIPDSLTTINNIRGICVALGHRPSSYSAGGGGSSGMHSTTRTYDCHVDLPKNLRGPFMQAYRQHVRDVLDKHADKVHGGGAATRNGVLTGFDFDYAKGKTRGTVVVRCISNEQELALIVFIHENESPP